MVKYKAAGVTLTDQEYTDAIVVFNDMMEELAANDIQLGFSYIETKEDPVTIPLWANRFIDAKLAVSLAPEFGAAVPRELLIQLRDSKRIISKRLLDGFSVQMPETLPLGTTEPDSKDFFGNSRLDDVDTDVDAWIDDDGTPVEEDDAPTGTILTG
jgi:hypothetical protein